MDGGGPPPPGGPMPPTQTGIGGMPANGLNPTTPLAPEELASMALEGA